MHPPPWPARARPSPSGIDTRTCEANDEVDGGSDEQERALARRVHRGHRDRPPSEACPRRSGIRREQNGDAVVAVQIADDLLDYTGTADEVGKPTGLDLREHKVTLPLIAAMRQMSQAGKSEVEAFFADPVPSDEGIARVVELVVDHGGLDYARSRAEEFGALAAESLRDVPDSESARALHEAIAYVIGRRL